MKNFINRRILETTKFSSTTLGPLAYLLHKMSSDGSFSLEIYHKNTVIVRSEIECSNDFKKTYEHVDIAKVYQDKKISRIRLNSENGYLLFYNSKEFAENRIVIKNKKLIEFDSFKPAKGDLYTLNLLKPGMYKFQSSSLESDLLVNVEYPSMTMSKESRFKQSVMISTATTKQTNDYKMLPNQGLSIELGNGIKEFKVEMISENLPAEGESISEQIKKQATQLNVKKGQKKESNVSRKYQWRPK